MRVRGRVGVPSAAGRGFRREPADEMSGPASLPDRPPHVFELVILEQTGEATMLRIIFNMLKHTEERAL